MTARLLLALLLVAGAVAAAPAHALYACAGVMDVRCGHPQTASTCTAWVNPNPDVTAEGVCVLERH